MNQLSHTIKRLRREQNLSQENLAELLHITPAAVSKWENGVTMPDISQLIPLSNIFHVTVDALLGITSRDEEAEVRELLISIYQLEDIYPPEEGLHIVDAYRDALRQYPRNTDLLSEALAFSTGLLCNYQTVPAKEQKALIDDCTHWADLILRYDPTPDRISHAKQSMIDICAWRQEWDRALEMAKELPGDMYRLRDLVTGNLLRQAGRYDEEKKLHTQNVSALLRHLVTEATMLANRYRLDGNHNDALTCYRFLERVLDQLYGEEKYRPPFIRQGLSRYLYPAECCLALGQVEEALAYVEKYAEAYLAERDGFNRKTAVDSPLLRGNHYAYGFDGKAVFAEYAARDLAYGPLTPLHDHPRFLAVKKRLGIE